MDFAAAPLAIRRHPHHHDLDLDLLSVEFSDHRPYREPVLHLTRACLHHHRQRLADAGVLRPLWAAAHLFTDISPRALKELILRWSPSSKAFWRSEGWTTPTGEDVDSLAELSFEDDRDLVNMSLGPSEVLLFDQLLTMTTALKNLGRERRRFFHVKKCFFPCKQQQQHRDVDCHSAPHVIWALKEDDREVYRWVEMAYTPHLVMRQFGLDQTRPHYFNVGFLSKSRSKPMISHFFPNLQNVNAVPLPAYSRVGWASSTFISRWPHFLSSVRVTRGPRNTSYCYCSCYTGC